MTTQDPELSAALGWPGGISDPVLDRKVLLQMVAALMRDRLWEDHRVRHLWDHAQQAEPVQMHPSQFAELIKGKETMVGVPVYWSEWPTKETHGGWIDDLRTTVKAAGGEKR